MSRFLLAAEADKIQDLLFRSSRLREVVGGSQLLTRFCREVPRLLLKYHGGDPEKDVIIKDGGSFRVLFDDEKRARAFGEELAELYRLATGGSLTVAQPVEVREGDFRQAAEHAQSALRAAKQRLKGWHIPEQMPYMALCGSCGLGIATVYTAVYPGEEEYVCASCLNKNAERAHGYRDFLEPFRLEVIQGEPELENAAWPGYFEHENDEDGPEHALEAIASYDPRRYVAYLLADGNNMGELFSRCTGANDMRTLSDRLHKVILKALAEPTRELMKTMRMEVSEQCGDWIPVLPLIMGGDDVFALVPAPWALDFARRFCEVYEREMGNALSRLGDLNDTLPSVAVAVVICKSKHPYAHAHEVGERYLTDAKRLGKRVGNDGGFGAVSAINFEVIVGGKMEEPVEYGDIRPTLRPYLLRTPVAEGEERRDGCLSLHSLLDKRWALRRLPRKRCAELENTFDALPRDTTGQDYESWLLRLYRLLCRIERFYPDEGAVLRRLMSGLREPGDAPVGELWRYVRKSHEYGYGHELPDLLKVWDFAFRLDRPRRLYEGGESDVDADVQGRV